MSTAAPAAAAGPASGRPARHGAWVRGVLVGIVFLYVGLLIVAPIGGLVAGALEHGLGPALATFHDPSVIKSFVLTVQIALVVLAVHGVFGTLVAWMLVRDPFRGRRVLDALIDLPFAVSPVVVGYMLLLLFGRQGLLAPVLAPLGVKVAFAVPGMVLATLFVSLPFMIRELVPVLEGFGVQQEQAAATLGASGWVIFWRVTLPALRWGFIYGLTLTLARALGEFGAVLVVGGGVQGRTETATLFIYRALDERQYVGAYTAGLALGVLSLALVMGTEVLRRREERS